MAPFVVRGSRYTVLIHSAVARERRSTVETLGAAVRRCGALLPLNDAAQTGLVVSRAFQDFEQAVAGRPLVALTIVPVGTQPVDCKTDPAETQALLEFGIEFGADTLGSPASDAGALTVEVDGVPVVPTMVGRAPMRKVAPDNYVGGNGLHSLRVYLSLEDLAPRGSARSGVRLNVRNLQDSIPTTIAIPDDLVSELRRELIGWRARRLAGGASMASDMPIAVPTPSDEFLREAHQAYVARSYTDASTGAIARLAGAELSKSDRLSANMQLGLTFAGSGDVAAARVLFREAILLEPCLRLPSSVASLYRALLDEMRPVARCEAVDTRRVVRAGLIPGGVDRSLYPARGIGLDQMFAMGGALAASVILRGSARSLYEEYQAGFRDPAAAYERAIQRNTMANIAAVAFWGAYAWPVVRAIRTERRRARELPELTNYGGLRAPRVSVEPARGAVGLSVYFF